MVRYIRYLRTPQVEEHVRKKVLNVTATLAVVTDLGDAYLQAGLTLIARLVDATGRGEILTATDVSWLPISRAVKVSLPCKADLRGRLCVLHITTKDTINAVMDGRVPSTYDCWSASFNIKPKSRAEVLVERRLVFPSANRALRIWEETGDSIARHVWDASIASVSLLYECLQQKSGEDGTLPALSAYLATTKKLRVLELGSGCGTVGIGFAQVRKCEMLLSDLDDAQDILKTNIDAADPALGSTISRQVLGWGTDFFNVENPRFDLVLVSDCIYNPESSVLLVQTLEELAKHNPDIRVFLAYKNRHEADSTFFDAIEKTRLTVINQTTIQLPHLMTDYDEEEPKIEAFLYTFS